MVGNKIRCYCRLCQKPFIITIRLFRIGYGVYCSRNCYMLYRKIHNTIEKECKVCHKIFRVGKGDRNDNFYCSRDCCYKDPEHLKIMSRPHSEENKLRLARIAKKRFEKEIIWNKGKKCPQITEALKGEKSCWFGKRGPQAANWKGADRPLYHFIRGSPEYIAWRKAVFERDYYKCKICDKKGNINCHHIKPFRQILKDNDIKTLDQAKTCKELFDINNGVTLCEPCHADMDEYFHRFKKHL